MSNPFVQFFKETTLPVNLVPDAIYYIELPNGLHVDTYVTDSQGSARSLGVSLMDSRIAAALSGLSIATAEVVADIDARDNYIATLESNQLVLVMDASDDSEVISGSALYIYEHGSAVNPGEGDIHRVPGFNGVNVTLDWSAIANKPQASVAAIDAAVAASHTHSNKPVLDKLGETDENGLDELTYNGNVLGETEAIAHTLVRRGPDGRAKVPAPQSSSDIANKQYVDDKMGASGVMWSRVGW